jgi:hypothetical protein
MMYHNYGLNDPGRMYITSDHDLKEARGEGRKAALTAGAATGAGLLATDVAVQAITDRQGMRDFVTSNMDASAFKNEFNGLFKAPAKMGDATTPSLFEQGGNALKSTGKFMKNQAPEVGKLAKAVAASKEGKTTLALAGIGATLIGAVKGSEARDARIKAPTDAYSVF